MSTASPLPLHAARVAAAVLALIVFLALLVWVLGAGHQARQLLGLSFARPARDPDAALEIAATNLRLVGACLVAALAVSRRPQLRRPLDVALLALLSLNAAAFGAALGGYGGRVLEAVALHAPFELAAFALAGGAYLAARTGQLSLNTLALSAGTAVALVAAGAVFETYVQLGGDS